MDIYQLKITLLGIEPKIYRVVQIPSEITLRNLHKVIQKVMAWENCHLYQRPSSGTANGIPPWKAKAFREVASH